MSETRIMIMVWLELNLLISELQWSILVVGPTAKKKHFISVSESIVLPGYY